LYDNEYFQPLARALESYEASRPLDHPYWQSQGPCSMHIEEVEAIWAPIAESDDWSALENKVSQIRQMGEAMS
jgi:serine/tyrosine/threonine adenylyltransferase